jgi:hypothetical protein
MSNTLAILCVHRLLHERQNKVLCALLSFFLYQLPISQEILENLKAQLIYDFMCTLFPILIWSIRVPKHLRLGQLILFHCFYRDRSERSWKFSDFSHVSFILCGPFFKHSWRWIYLLFRALDEKAVVFSLCWVLLWFPLPRRSSAYGIQW